MHKGRPQSAMGGWFTYVDRKFVALNVLVNPAVASRIFLHTYVASRGYLSFYESPLLVTLGLIVKR